ncbi:putative cytochrome P450 [Exophiala viscosa]|uniref:putative cytochrome P450 n=1 Tax=Exophiala viscosa TaxID=2486360 RepID=UPI002197FB3D|nr:putative cytochrome P450 [Exophiala viscosa]
MVISYTVGLLPYLLAVAALIRVILRLLAPLAKLPGPWYTALTSLVLNYHEFTHGRTLYIHRLHQKYGPVVRLAPNEVSFSTADAVKEIYMSGGSGYDKTEFYSLFTQFRTRTLFSTLPRADHSYMKRYMADRYANTSVMKPEVLDGVSSHAKDFLKKCLEGCAAVSYADIYIHLHCFALDGVTHQLFHPYGTHANRDEKDFRLAKEMSYHDSLKSNFALYYMPWASDVVHYFNPPKPAPLTNDYVLKSSAGSSPSPFSLLSKLQAQAKATSMPPHYVPAECKDHLAAGVDTTGDALCFLMYQLSQPTLESERIQGSLRKELMENPSTPFDRLPYLDAVVKEGLRCFPPIPMSMPRYVPQGGSTIEAHHIPGGTIVSCQVYTVHKDPSVFPQPLEFQPERWLDAQGEIERNRWFSAFGAGGRGCLGRHLAMAEMKLLLREVYSQCRTTVSDQMNSDMEMEDQIIASRPKGQCCKLVFEKVG